MTKKSTITFIKRTWTLIVGILFILSLACALISCNKVKFKIDFIVDNQVYATIDTNGKAEIAIPNDPTKEGYTFEGWYWDNEIWEKPFTANSLLDVPLSENMSIYAKWKEIHTHKYSGEWKSDDANHYYACECGDKKDVSAHVYDKTATSDTYKASEASCTAKATYFYSCVCGKKGTTTFESGEALGHSFTNYVSDDNATCTDNGTETAKCDRCEVTDTREVENTALGHNYGEVTYTWSDDNTTCTATRVCARDNSHIEMETVTVTSEVTQNKSCTDDELTKYTATFANTAFATQTKENVKTADKLGHSYSNNWTSNETHHYHECGCGEKADESIHEYDNKCDPDCNECGKIREVEHSCSETLTQGEHTHWYECSVCGYQNEEKAHEYDQQVVEDKYKASDATCTEKARYYATCVCGKKGNTFEYGEALGHSYGEVTYTWADDNSICTARRVCSRNTNHIEMETVTVTSEVTQNKSCTDDELTKYTATFANTAFATQTKENVKTADKLGHSFTNYVSNDNATCTDNETETAKCDRCEVTDTKEIENTALGHSYASEYTTTDTHHWHAATCGHSEEKSNYEEHTYVNYVCSECGKMDENSLYSTLYNNIPRTREDIKDNTTLTDTYKETTVMSLDFTNSNLTEEQQQTMFSYVPTEPIVVDEKTIYAYKDADSGEAYRLNYIKEGEDYVLDPDTTPIYYFKSGEKYYKFIKAKGTADYVSKGHAQYSILEATNDMLSFLTEAPKNYSEFAEYIRNGMAEWGTILTPEDITTSWGIEDNQYKFLITISSTSGRLFEDNIEIIFTENAITKFTVKSKDTYNTNKADPEGDGYTIMNMSSKMETRIEFSTGFDESVMDKDLSTVEYVSNYKIKGNQFVNGAFYVMFDNDDSEVGFTPREIYLLPDLEWYLDEECTIEFTQPLKCKSYESVNVYAKTDTIPEGYAEVITFKQGDDYAVFDHCSDGETVNAVTGMTTYVYVNGSETPIVTTEDITIEAGNKYYIEFKYNN